GNTAANVIFRDFNLSSRLPITFLQRIKDCPAYLSFLEEQLSSYYSKGLYISY
ncbi:hypothetical protein C7974DRAFT_305662, partial [Boeremia exigua]|uniref:uncharacterized protein n=1 Tax=Boeremia exigua TaxID=749465 RepID=UPI001E8EE71A